MPVSITRKKLSYLSFSFRIPGIVFVFSGIYKILDPESFRGARVEQWSGHSKIKDLNAF
jgi:hypothetical protein